MRTILLVKSCSLFSGTLLGECIRNSCILAPPLTLSCKIEEFVPTCSWFSSNTTMKGVTRTTAEINRLCLTILDHPPHIPDMAPTYFHLFPELKKHLREHHCLSDDEVKTAMKMWFRQHDAQFHSEEIVKISARGLSVWGAEVIKLRSSCVKL
jgi:hypothetical protein